MPSSNLFAAFLSKHARLTLFPPHEAWQTHNKMSCSKNHYPTPAKGACGIRVKTGHIQGCISFHSANPLAQILSTVPMIQDTTVLHHESHGKYRQKHTWILKK